MARCVPANEQEGSRLVSSLKTMKRSTFWGKFFGCLCMPFMCAGLVCCIPALVLEDTISSLQNVITYYTVPILDKLREKVDGEQRLFLDACSNVNTSTEGPSIISNMTLIEIIRQVDSKIGALLNDPGMVPSLTFLITNQKGKEQYRLDVYNEYIKLGGNISVIIFGLPEYMAIIMDPTCDKMCKMYSNVMHDSQLHRLAQSHRGTAGF
jgi:hypothetical protein